MIAPEPPLECLSQWRTFICMPLRPLLPVTVLAAACALCAAGLPWGSIRNQPVGPSVS